MEQAINHVPSLDLDADLIAVDGALEQRLSELPVADDVIGLASVDRRRGPDRGAAPSTG